MAKDVQKVESGNTKMNRSKVFLAGLAIIIIAVGGYFYTQRNNSSSHTIQVPFPYTLSVVGKTSFACEALLNGDILSGEIDHVLQGVEGKIGKGSDRVAGHIEDSKTLSFITAAAVKAGRIEGDKFTIVRNDEEALIAIWFDNQGIDSFILNKEIGLAVWLKENTDFPLYQTPYGLVSYLNANNMLTI